MADPSSPVRFEDVPLDDARRLRRGPRMEPMLYDTLRHVPGGVIFWRSSKEDLQQAQETASRLQTTQR